MNKIKLLSLVGLILPMLLGSCRQHEPGVLTLTGEIRGLPEGRVKLYTYPPSNLLLDSCEIRNGQFVLEGKLEEAQLGMLFFDVKPEYQQNFSSVLRIFLQPTDMHLYFVRDSMKESLKIEHAPMNDELVASEKYLRSLPEYGIAARLSDSIQLAFYKADMLTVRSLSVIRDSLYQILIDRLFENTPGATHSQVVAFLASQYTAPMSGKEVSRVVERFDPAFRTSYYVKQMEEFAIGDQQLGIGKRFPDFQVFDSTGKNYTLADFEGKYLFVEFSASWCGWCKKEIPHIRKAYEQLKDRNIVFITMMMDTDREQWCKDIEKDGIEWTCLSDLKGMKKSPLVESYNLRGLPDSFVVDPEGVIISRELRGGEVLNFLSQVTESK